MDDVPAWSKDQARFSQVTPAEPGLPVPPTELQQPTRSSAPGQFKRTKHVSKPRAKKHKPQ